MRSSGDLTHIRIHAAPWLEVRRREAYAKPCCLVLGWLAFSSSQVALTLVSTLAGFEVGREKGIQCLVVLLQEHR
jgi:hypothetical protein